MDLAALVLAAVTLVIALFIHSEVRQALSRVNAIIDTLPGAYDVKRLIKDIEDTGDQRGHVVSHAPKNTYIRYTVPWPETPRYKKIKNKIWRGIFGLAQVWSGDVYEQLVLPSKPAKWAFNSALSGSCEAEKFIAEDWEPFSVTSENKLWFRKLVEASEKEADS